MSLIAFLFLYMAFIIDLTNECSLSNDPQHKLVLNKSKVMLYTIVIHYTVKAILTSCNYIHCTNKMECFSLKVGMPCKSQSL